MCVSVGGRGWGGGICLEGQAKLHRQREEVRGVVGQAQAEEHLSSGCLYVLHNATVLFSHIHKFILNICMFRHDEHLLNSLHTHRRDKHLHIDAKGSGAV